MKVLISAFSCWPTESSEPGVGWRFAHLAAREHEVWVLTDTCNRAKIEKWQRENPTSPLQFVYFGLEGRWRFLERRFFNLYYDLWHRLVIRKIAPLHAKVGLDVVHHVSTSRYWTPSSLSRLDLRFIWGPLGAAETAPPALMRELPLKFRILDFARNAIRAFYEVVPGVRRTAREAAVVFTMSEDTAAKLRALGARHVELLPPRGMEPLAPVEIVNPPPTSLKPLRLISIGRHLHWKGFHLGILAVAELVRRGVAVEYNIINDGPFTPVLQSMARNSIANEHIHFLGFLPTAKDVDDCLQSSHFLIHPALHEGFGQICMESLAAGRPVVCLNIGGPAVQVTSECGLVVEPGSQEQTVARMADALQAVVENPEHWEKMVAASRERVREHFSTERLLEAMRRAYNGA